MREDLILLSEEFVQQAVYSSRRIEGNRMYPELHPVNCIYGLQE